MQHQDLQDQEQDDPLNLIDYSIASKNYKAQQYRIASISYGLFFALVGIVLSTIEPFKACM